MIVSIVTLYQWKLHSFVMMHCSVCTDQGRFPFNLKFRKIWLVHQNNGMDYFSLVRPEYARPALKVVHFDRSCCLGQSDRNVPFHLTKLLSPVPLFCILLTRTITKCTVAWVGSVQPECTVLLGMWNFRNVKPEFWLNGKRLRATTFPQFMKQFAASSKQGCKYRKIPKISPGLIFFKGPF